MKKAVALKYDSKTTNAPKLTAKGNDKTAQKIIQLAKENNIPIKEDKNLIEMLSEVELNKEVPPQMYKAIAEIFSWVYNSSKKELFFNWK